MKRQPELCRAIVVRIEKGLIDGAYRFLLVTTSAVPKYVMSWISRHTLAVGRYYVTFDATGLCDYIVELPDGSEKMLHRPGPNRLKRYLKSMQNG